VTIFGESDSPTLNPPALISLSSSGGRFGSAPVGNGIVNGGLITGAAGNIAIEGGTGGVRSPGRASFNSRPARPPASNGGSTTYISATGGPGAGGRSASRPGRRHHGEHRKPAGQRRQWQRVVRRPDRRQGRVGINSSSDAAASTAAATPFQTDCPPGSVGTSIIFDGPVTATHIVGDALSGTVIFKGLVTTGDFDQIGGNDSSPANTN